MQDAWSTEGGLLRRLMAEGRAKVLLYVALSAAFCIPYWVLQRYPLFEAGRFELTAFDHWVGFHPAWLWVYQSTYLLIPIAPLLAVRKAELGVFARGYLIMTAIGVGFFVFFPIDGPRPMDVPTDGLWAILLLYDTTLNTFPSLHIAMVTQSLAFAVWLIRGRWTGGMIACMVVAVTWALMIAYSTVATKQHYAIDVPAGLVLGWLSHLCATRMRLGARVPLLASLRLRTP
jgi:membrane-associated phospholipid phosphatase